MPTEQDIQGDEDYVDDEDFQFQNEIEPDDELQNEYEENDEDIQLQNEPEHVHDETQKVTECKTTDTHPGN